MPLNLETQTMNTTRRRRFCLARCPGLSLALLLMLCGVAHGQSSKPAFQYEVGDVRVSIPTADEPRAKALDRKSTRLNSSH